MKEWTREEVERLVPEIKEPWKYDVWKSLLQTRLDLEMAKKHIDEHYTRAATDYIKELEGETFRLRGALERIDKIDRDGDEEWANSDVESDSHWMELWAEQLNDCGNIAREALRATK